MKKGIVLDANDIKKLLAEHFNVSEDKIIKSQYSYTVVLDEDEDSVKEDFSVLKAKPSLYGQWNLICSIALVGRQKAF